MPAMPTESITYLSGAVRPEFENLRTDLGFLITPLMGNRPDLGSVAWGADTGCFTQPDKYNTESYISWLEARRADAGTCLFATAPDVVGDPIATLERSLPVLPLIRQAGFKASFVAQDGLKVKDVPWDAFDNLFIGGSTDWKLSHASKVIARVAKGRGKTVHMGRVNSLRRLRIAQSFGCDSADGTFVAFGPRINGPKVQGWLDVVNEGA